MREDVRLGQRPLLYLLLAALAGCAAPAPRVPTAGEAAVAAATPSIYVVRRGDTLSAIARRHGTSLSALQDLNALQDPDRLEIGDRLRVPSAAGRGRVVLLSWPVTQLQVTSEFGARGGRHQGIDLGAPKGNPVLAAADGVVEFSGKQKGYGRVLILRHANDVKTLYAHNRKNLVVQGQRVSRGQRIAKVGHSGRATGSHVHFETIIGGRKVNPRHYVVGQLSALPGGAQQVVGR